MSDVGEDLHKYVGGQVLQWPLPWFHGDAENSGNIAEIWNCVESLKATV